MWTSLIYRAPAFALTLRTKWTPQADIFHGLEGKLRKDIINGDRKSEVIVVSNAFIY